MYRAFYQNKGAVVNPTPNRLMVLHVGGKNCFCGNQRYLAFRRQGYSVILRCLMVALVRSRFIRHSKPHCSYANYVASVP